LRLSDTKIIIKVLLQGMYNDAINDRYLVSREKFY